MTRFVGRFIPSSAETSWDWGTPLTLAGYSLNFSRGLRGRADPLGLVGVPLITRGTSAAEGINSEGNNLAGSRVGFHFSHNVHATDKVQTYQTYITIDIDFFIPSLPASMANASDASYNATISCVYPLSGQYGVLQRWKYYSLLALAVFTQNHKWLLGAILGTVVPYVGVTAVHAFALIMTASERTMVIDLDIVGSFFVLAIVNVVLWPLKVFAPS